MNLMKSSPKRSDYIDIDSIPYRDCDGMIEIVGIFRGLKHKCYLAWLMTFGILRNKYSQESNQSRFSTAFPGFEIQLSLHSFPS
ncbi:unnamed protein product [Pocillopora meandrina]|uniref:Uncharacterized protein n=1 Tax=Pocillopora meandrina TaxID=46732 RepID=A0AAU9XQK3_9CNID|nr:unnamed protein product [Pocillopora meandrina]